MLAFVRWLHVFDAKDTCITESMNKATELQLIFLYFVRVGRGTGRFLKSGCPAVVDLLPVERAQEQRSSSPPVAPD